MLLVFIILSIIINLVNGHVMMRDPPARRSKYSEYYVSQGLVDYNLNAPLNFEPYTFPCKGYTKGPVTSVINSNIINIQLEGTAIHGGGHCQFGVTFDDQTFVVLRTVISDCLLTGMSYSIELPQNISGEVTVFWTWINRIGNREYYMDCADIRINGVSNTPVEVTGKELLVVNLPGYPIIPEGLPPGNDGVDLLNARGDISVLSGSGEQISPIQNTTTQQQTTTTQQQTTTTQQQTTTTTQQQQTTTTQQQQTTTTQQQQTTTTQQQQQQQTTTTQQQQTNTNLLTTSTTNVKYIKYIKYVTKTRKKYSNPTNKVRVKYVRKQIEQYSDSECEEN